QIVVRDGKGFKDRVTMLPDSLVEKLKSHMIYTHVLNKGGKGVRSPLDSL
ncbi:MAG: integron integrase, partial [Burkholderiales bacterium]|nr:integron integrase [Burkholderiales bacterium]